jgi:hypothetical protein
MDGKSGFRFNLISKGIAPARGLGECYHFAEKLAGMQTSIKIIEQIIRAKTALHLKLVALRKDSKVCIGGARIDDLIADVDAGLVKYEWMLVLFKNELAAAVMEAEATASAAPEITSAA